MERQPVSLVQNLTIRNKLQNRGEINISDLQGTKTLKRLGLAREDRGNDH